MGLVPRVIQMHCGGQTSCGICAKVCPPQCIWIVQGKGDDGRPRPLATEFYIDASICMSCGFCAEYCPFDAIKMGHEYELASYDRTTAHIWDKAKHEAHEKMWTPETDAGKEAAE